MKLMRSDIISAMKHHIQELRGTESVAWSAVAVATTAFVVEVFQGGPTLAGGGVAFMVLMVAVFLRKDLNSLNQDRKNITRKLDESLGEPDPGE